MRYSTGLILAAMTIGDAMAGPTHAHLHRRAHEKKDVDWSTLDWDDMGIDWASAYSAGMASKAAATATPAVAQAAAPAVTTAATVAPAPQAPTSSSSSSTSSSVESTAEGLLGNVIGLANTLTTFGSASSSSGSGIGKIGNYGSPQGSNIIKVSSREGYAFTNEFINTSPSSMTINCWNKAAYWEGKPATLDPNLGASIAPNQTALTFALAPGASQIVAYMEDTQFGCAQACTERAYSGGFATTWIEGNFASSGSGYDVSAIQNPNNNNYDMTITSVEAPACTSSRTENMWLTDSDPVGGSDGSCYIAQSTATLTTKMGGTIS